MIIKKYTSLLLLLSLIGQTSAMEQNDLPAPDPIGDERILTEQLCDAIKYSDLEKAEELLDQKVDPNTSNCIGLTPLLLAAVIGDLNACKLLIKYGANPSLPACPALNSELPLHGALAAPIVRSTLASLLPVNKNNYDDIAFYFIEECKVNPNATCGSKDTFLHQAAFTGNIKILETLLQKGAHPNITNIYNSNVLHSAAFSFGGKTDEQSLQCIMELLRCGIDYKAKNKEDKTPAQYATSELVVEALKNDSSVKKVLISGTSLHEKNIYKELNGRAITGKSMRHEKFDFKRTEALFLGNK